MQDFVPFIVIGGVVAAIGTTGTPHLDVPTEPSTPPQHQSVDRVQEAIAPIPPAPINTDQFINPQSHYQKTGRLYEDPLLQGIHELAHQGQISPETLKVLERTPTRGNW